MTLDFSRGKDLIILINFKIVGYRNSLQQLIMSKLLKKRPLRAKDIFKEKVLKEITDIRRFWEKGEDFENLRRGGDEEANLVHKIKAKERNSLTEIRSQHLTL